MKIIRNLLIWVFCLLMVVLPIQAKSTIKIEVEADASNQELIINAKGISGLHAFRFALLMEGDARLEDIELNSLLEKKGVIVNYEEDDERLLVTVTSKNAFSNDEVELLTCQFSGERNDSMEFVYDEDTPFEYVQDQKKHTISDSVVVDSEVLIIKQEEARPSRPSKDESSNITMKKTKDGSGTWVILKNGKTRFKDKQSGKYVMGLKEIDGKHYIFAEDTYLVRNQLIDYGGLPYYANEDGSLATSWKLVDDVWYFFEEDGKPADRWVANAVTWFMIEKGKMLSNSWVASSEGRWYYVGNDGSIVANQWVDGCWINEEGIYYSPTYN